MNKKVTWEKSWAAVDESKYSMLFSYLKQKIENLDEFTYITDHKRKIMSLIEAHPSWADTSKEGLMFMVAKFLKLKQDTRYAKLYSQRGYDYLKGNREKESLNQQSPKEIENYRGHEYFINILDSINYDAITTITEHYKYLFLSLLTYQPPVRSSFYTHCLFITSDQQNNRLNNFIKISRRLPVTVSYIINTDKVSKTKVYSMNKDLSVIKLIDPKLTKLVIDSYVKYPRMYLFEVNEKPISQPTLLAWLRDITKLDAIDVDIMRSSYINWFYDHNKTVGARERLAAMMRHSSATAQRNYLKVFDDDLQPEKLSENVVELQTEIYQLKKDCTSEEVGDVKFRKKKRDVLRTMNSGGTPRESTLSKYNITYDSDLKLYK